MPNRQIKAGMKYGSMESKYNEMLQRAEKMGGKVEKDGNKIVLKDKNGGIWASLFTYTIDGETTYRYSDFNNTKNWDGAYDYVGTGKEPTGKFTEILTDTQKAVDLNGDGIVNENEIDINF